MPYHLAAGEKLLEAKSQLKQGEFMPWVKLHLPVTVRQGRTYMRLAEASSQKGSALPFSSLSDVMRQIGAPTYNKGPAWHEPVKQIINRVDTATLDLRREDLKRAEEREAQRKLGLQAAQALWKVVGSWCSPRALTRDRPSRPHSKG
jgi:hypothetical protein